jgi:hypothetical protein
LSKAEKAAEEKRLREEGKAALEAASKKTASDGPDVTHKIPRDKLKYKPKKRGNAPIGEDGKPVELHHNNQELGNASSRSEMTRTDHRGKGNFAKNHTNTGKSPSKVERGESGTQHRKHWENELDAGEFEHLPDQP